VTSIAAEHDPERLAPVFGKIMLAPYGGQWCCGARMDTRFAHPISADGADPAEQAVRYWQKADNPTAPTLSVGLDQLELTHVCYAPPELPFTGPVYPGGIRVVAAIRIRVAAIRPDR
jgi:hypothetical protein